MADAAPRARIVVTGYPHSSLDSDSPAMGTKGPRHERRMDLPRVNRRDNAEVRSQNEEPEHQPLWNCCWPRRIEIGPCRSALGF